MAADPRFHPATGPQRLDDIAVAAGAPVPADGARLFTGVSPLESATRDEVAYLEAKRHLEAARSSRAGAVIVAPMHAEALREALGQDVHLLLADRPGLAFIRVATLFHRVARGRGGIHPTASVSESAVVGENCEIGPYAVVGEGAILGANCRLGPHAVVGPGCVLGDDCRMHAHSSMYCALAGRGVVLHAGARVGEEGFGFLPDEGGNYITVPQLGRVLLGDRVEIGANSCVDRGSAGDTVVGAGTRIDNLVMLGHNVRTGQGCVLVAQVGISGSTTLGDRVQVAGQAGLVGHIEVGTGARIGAQSGIMKNVPAGQDVLGTPAQPIREAMRAIAMLRRLAARGTGRDT